MSSLGTRISKLIVVPFRCSLSVFLLTAYLNIRPSSSLVFLPYVALCPPKFGYWYTSTNFQFKSPCLCNTHSTGSHRDVCEKRTQTPVHLDYIHTFTSYSLNIQSPHRDNLKTRWWSRASCRRMSVDILGTNWDQCRSTVQCCFTSTEARRLVRTESPGRPPRLSHNSWTLKTRFHYALSYSSHTRRNKVMLSRDTCLTILHIIIR